jgi:hypothetical protein
MYRILYNNYVTVYHLKMVLGPKQIVAVTTEEEKKDCCFDGIIKLSL